MNIEELIQKVKQQSEDLWNTIKQAEKENLKVSVSFNDFQTKPFITVTNILFSQGQF